MGQKLLSSKRQTGHIGNDVQRNYASVVEMDAVIETYQDVYATDLEERLAKTSCQLPCQFQLFLIHCLA
jgi:hypothetical protein